MKKTHIFLIASIFACNILSAAAIDYQSLFRATKRGDIESAQKFFRENRDIDINFKNKHGWTPLHKASQRGYVELVRLFLESGADVNVKNGTSGSTSLMYASLNGHIELVRLFLNRGADVNAKNYDGDTSLQYAVFNYDEEVVRLLLEQGAIDEKNKSGRTAAERAQEADFHDIEQLISSWNDDVKEPEGN